MTFHQGYRRELTGSEVLADLVPGTYLVTATPVTVEQDRYAAPAAAQSIGVASGGAVRVLVSYAVATGRLQLTVAGIP